MEEKWEGGNGAFFITLHSKCYEWSKFIFLIVLLCIEFDIKKVMKIDHHRGPVVCVAISSTSEVLVSGSTDGTICLWSLETYELLNMLQFNSPVINFCLSPDSVSAKGFVTDFPFLNNLQHCLFHIAGHLCQIFVLAHCEDNGLYLRTLATGTELHQLKGHKSKVNIPVNIWHKHLLALRLFLLIVSSEQDKNDLNNLISVSDEKCFTFFECNIYCANPFIMPGLEKRFS